MLIEISPTSMITKQQNTNENTDQISSTQNILPNSKLDSLGSPLLYGSDKLTGKSLPYQATNSKSFLSLDTVYVYPPASVTAKAASRTSITVSWSAGTGAEAYYVRRFNPNTGVFDNLVQTISLTYTDTTCVAGTNYRYDIVAYVIIDGVVHFAANSAEATATTPLYVAPPTTVTAKALSRTSISITWSAAAGAEAYYVRRYNPNTSQFDNIVQLTELTFTDTNCVANTTYRYDVVAYVLINGDIHFATVSTEATATTPLYADPPASVSATATSPTSVTVSWSSAAGAEGYFLKRFNSTTGEFDVINLTNNLSYVDSDRSPGINYRYHVVAYAIIGGVTQFANISTEATATTPLYVYPPSSVSATAQNAYSIKVSWSAALGAEGYFLKRYNPNTGVFDIINLTDALSYTDIACSPNTNYRYYVVSYKMVGGVTTFSTISTEATLTTPTFGSAPTNFTATAAATYVTVTWTAAQGVNGYVLRRYNPITLVFDNIAFTASLTYTDTTCTPNTFYRYDVLGYAQAGTNTYYTPTSTEATLTTPIVSGPPSMSAIAVGRNEITIKWAEGSNTESYVVRRATSASGPFTNITYTNNLIYTDTGRTAGATYYYDIVAVKVISDITHYASVLCTASATTQSTMASNNSLGYNLNRVVGVDQFGRSFGAMSGTVSNRAVGMFYFTLHGQGSTSIPGIFDNTKILAQPGGFNKLFFQNTSDSPANATHYWGEPLFGYYNAADPYVIRKHMELLSTAGVDFIMLDATNAWTYTSVAITIMRVIDEMQREGWNPPKVAFYTHSLSLDTIRSIYNDIYGKNLYPNAWYKINNKPMIVGYTNVADDLAEAVTRGDTSYNPAPLSSTILNFFSFKRPQWPNDPVYSDGIPWLEWVYPQPMHGTVMNIAVSTHPALPYSFSLTRGAANWGRGWNTNTHSNNYDDALRGKFFQSQWFTVLTAPVIPETVMITGWNEWVATKSWYDGEYTFCDAVNMEFSRDVEMMKGGYEDAFYQQLITYVRQYKATAPTATGYIAKTIDINGSGSQWDNVNAVFRNKSIANYGRNFINAAGTATYTQAAPRNNIQEVRVTTDSSNLYFYIRSEKAITAPSGTNWMNILIGRGTPSTKGWQGYEYLVNRFITGTSASVVSLASNFTGTSSGTATINRNGCILQVKVPRSAIGLSAGDNNFYFKVADDVTGPADAMNYYSTGSSLPMGRLSFQYNN